MYNAKWMYKIAEAIAFDKGPRTIPVDGQNTAAYALSRPEIEDIFEENGYSLNRSTWKSALIRWRSYGALVPKEIEDPKVRNWWIIFTNIDKGHYLELVYVAEDNNCAHLPKAAEGASA